MRLVTIEVLQEKVLPLLQQLEQLKLLRLIEKREHASASKRSWAGSLSTKTASKMLEQIEESRSTS